MSSDQLLSEFVDAWNAGRRPHVDDYLERVDAGERDALAEALMDWLALAPSPAYSPAVRAEIAAAPALRAVLAALDGPAGAWPELLPSLRSRAGLAVRDVAARLVATLGLGGGEERAASYLERMERGELDAARVSRRLLDALGAALGVTGAELADAGDLGTGLPRRPAAAGGMLFRRAARAPDPALADEFAALSAAALTPAPAPMDELDRLFTGGR